MIKVGIGIASYGQQSPKFWLPLANAAAQLYKDDIELVDIYHSGVSNPDVNRNNVARNFLEDGKADWLWWIDADNPPPLGALKRLLSLNQPMVSGLYWSQMPNNYIVIAYVKNKNGRYFPLNQVYTWERGELLQVDAVGMGCFLTHRDVYEKIASEYELFDRQSGGLLAVHSSKVHGKKPTEYRNKNRMGHVYDGVFYDPVLQHGDYDKFPFFECQHNRTEDLIFCEMAKEVGYEIWVDTTVEVGHVKENVIKGSDYREDEGLTPDPAVREEVVV